MVSNSEYPALRKLVLDKEDKAKGKVRTQDGEWVVPEF